MALKVATGIPGNANVRFAGFDAHDILGRFNATRSLNGVGLHVGYPEPSHVLRAIGLKTDDAESSIRFSLGFDTSDEDVEEAVGLIDETLTKLSKTRLVPSA